MDLPVKQHGDREVVRQVHLCAFGHHGAMVADLVDTLRAALAPGEGLSLVTERAGQVVGHVMFTRSLLDAPRRLVDVHVLSPWPWCQSTRARASVPRWSTAACRS